MKNSSTHSATRFFDPIIAGTLLGTFVKFYSKDLIAIRIQFEEFSTIDQRYTMEYMHVYFFILWEKFSTLRIRVDFSCPLVVIFRVRQQK